MKFKMRHSIARPYAEQGLIYFLCVNKKNEAYVAALCKRVGGEAYGPAIFEAVTSGDSLTRTAMEYHCSESTLFRYVKKFYEAYALKAANPAAKK